MVIPTVLQNQAVAGTTTICSILDAPVLKKCYMRQCIGKIREVPSNHMSKTDVHVKLTNNTSLNMGNSLLSLSSHTYGRHCMQTILGPYTIKGKDGTEIDFMCLTMTNPASSWFELVELPVTTDADVDIPMDTKGQKGL